MKKLMLIGFICATVSGLSFALPNPAAVNCAKQGFQYKLLNNKGYCVFPDHSYCEEWAFFRGECKPGQLKLPIPESK